MKNNENLPDYILAPYLPLEGVQTIGNGTIDSKYANKEIDEKLWSEYFNLQ